MENALFNYTKEGLVKYLLQTRKAFYINTICADVMATDYTCVEESEVLLTIKPLTDSDSTFKGDYATFQLSPTEVVINAFDKGKGLIALNVLVNERTYKFDVKNIHTNQMITLETTIPQNLLKMEVDFHDFLDKNKTHSFESLEDLIDNEVAKVIYEDFDAIQSRKENTKTFFKDSSNELYLIEGDIDLSFTNEVECKYLI